MKADPIQHVTVAGNTIRGNRGNAGVEIEHSRYGLLSGNTICENTGPGILIKGITMDWMITNNHIYHQKDGIIEIEHEEQKPDRNMIRMNRVIAETAKTIVTMGTKTVSMMNHAEVSGAGASK